MVATSRWRGSSTVAGAPSSCAANADITGVEAISTEVGNPNNAVSDIFHCADHYGVTDVLPAGTYTISVDAFNASMAAVGTADAIDEQVDPGPEPRDRPRYDHDSAQLSSDRLM